MNFDPHAYSVQIKRTSVDDEMLFVGTVLELPHVRIFEENYRAAYDGVIEVIQGLYEDAQEAGKAFPTPAAEEQHSGRMTLRMGPGLHARLDAKAKRDGLSQNSTAVALIAGGLAAEETASALIERCTAEIAVALRREGNVGLRAPAERRRAMRTENVFGFTGGMIVYERENKWDHKNRQ
jgi:predicted HicB family RNase H-like nuclease